MSIYLHLFGADVPAYGTMAVLGFCVGIITALWLGGKIGLQRKDILCGAGYGGVGLAAGAKLFYAIPFLPLVMQTIKEEGISYVQNHTGDIFREIFAGYVFYGGFLGMVLGVWFYLRMMRLWAWPFFDVLAVAASLFQGFGRIGCFLAGCCYGKEYHGIFAVQFPKNPYEAGIEEVTRFPVQLAESICCFLLFFLLLRMVLKGNAAGRAMGCYLMAYPILRFALEYLRADRVRGVFSISFFTLSTSQIISILLFPIGYKIYKNAKKGSNK